MDWFILTSLDDTPFPHNLKIASSRLLHTNSTIRVGDDQLDWDGPQVGQGTVPGENDEEYQVQNNVRL